MDGSLGPNTPVPPDPWSIPLEGIDPSRAELYTSGLQYAYFRRLRQEDPVHYCARERVRALLVDHHLQRHHGGGFQPRGVLVATPPS